MFPSVVAALLAVVPFLAQTSFAATCARNYTVQQGDICDSISAAHNVSTYQLSAVNPQIDSTCDNLIPGEVLCLGLVGQDCANTYVVRANDLCDQIAGAHGINTTVLFANNPNIDADCANIYIGEVLCVASVFGAAPPPPPASPVSVSVSTSASPVQASVSVSTSAASPVKVSISSSGVTSSASASLTSVAAPAITTSKSVSSPTTPSPVSPPSPSPSSSDEDNSDGDDDDDLPFCDEL